jgi:hypothetical protein
MNEKDKFDAMMKLADFYMGQRKERREFEWRISLATWVFLAAGIGTIAAVRSRLVDFGFQVVPRARQAPENLGALVNADADKWWPIIKELGIKAE